ncbi:MAG: regulatory protein RecX [Acidobacteria bacterium]|nr:regulatory protein RecX [Acidobacteriota bacterium]
MSDEILKSALRDLALKLLARREYSTRELRIKLSQMIRLQRHRLPPGNFSRAISAVIRYLTENRYLDDRRFAQLVAHHGQQNQYGNARIWSDLKRRGIDDKIATSVLSEAAGDTGALQRAIEFYVERRGEPSQRRDLQRFYRHLLRLGHPPSEVRRWLSPFFKKIGRS